LSLDSSYCHHYWKEFKLTQLQPAMKATQLMLISNGSLKSFQAIVKCGQITRLTVSHCNMYHKQIHKTQTKKKQKNRPSRTSQSRLFAQFSQFYCWHQHSHFSGGNILMLER